MNTADYWIKELQLLPHPEGGFYKETYRSSENIATNGLPQRFNGERSFCTAIYYLLHSHERSVFHKIKSDEIWHFYAGTALTIYVFEKDQLKTYRLGPNIHLGDHLQIVVPANCWFGAKVLDENSYTLAGCTVAPGFDFVDFEIANRSVLKDKFLNDHSIIELLT